jgi:hypothetical protein
MVSNLGEYICRGCSGAVYELKVIDQQMENGENGRQQQQQSADSLKVISNELFILQITKCTQKFSAILWP